MMADRHDSERLRGFASEQTNGQTDLWTFVICVVFGFYFAGTGVS